MQALIATEFRCEIYKGEYYLAPQVYTIFKRYAYSFGKLIICSRLKEISNIPKGHCKATFVKKIIAVNGLMNALLGNYDQYIYEAVKCSNLVIGRLPSIIAYRVFGCASKLNKKYMSELMCDGFDSYWYHSTTGKLIAPYMHYKMKQVAWKSDYAVYVTRQYLQERYPCKNGGIAASNVAINLPDESVLLNRLEKIKLMDKKNIILMTTADVDTRSKGHKYVIQALKELNNTEYRFTYQIAGGGDQRYLKNIAKKYGVLDKVVFLGRLNKEEVIKALDECDIYVHPSMQEGLPRAMIEAMSRGCPCIGARTAGIPELVAEECVFERKSSVAIVESVLNLIGKDITRYARENFEHSKDFTEDKLNKIRRDYFEKIVQ